MPFRLTNAPAIFCTLMYEILHPYLDQFVVSSIATPWINMRSTIKKSSKSYERTSSTSSGRSASPPSPSKGELRMDEAKIRAIQEWEAPMKVTKLIISGYSAKSANLTELLNKNKSWAWSKECQRAFEGLKAEVTEES
uniref:Reverse transcriptase/retrotransposon-derived protein RNase H-like domain-containing protein n=1 Tax=Solanum lycopersicum TaxID=4081 RepID=A0A3Q7IYU3_SOLLC